MGNFSKRKASQEERLRCRHPSLLAGGRVSHHQRDDGQWLPGHVTVSGHLRHFHKGRRRSELTKVSFPHHDFFPYNDRAASSRTGTFRS